MGDSGYIPSPLCLPTDLLHWKLAVNILLLKLESRQLDCIGKKEHILHYDVAFSLEL